jgi:predicted outer membrane repeat protein
VDDFRACFNLFPEVPMKTHSWFRNLFARSGTRPIRKRPPRTRLSLESLEDRCVPTTFTVVSSADDVTQNHTLRYAVAHAQSGDTILLTAAIKDPIVLTNGELVVSQNVTIESVPARTPTISGNGTSRVFEIAAGATVTLENLNLSDGNGLADNPSGTGGYDSVGGAILNFGTLAISDCTLSGNSALAGTSSVAGFPVQAGGGIYNAGTLTIAGSTLSGNMANTGGGIENGDAIAAFVSGNVGNATLTISDSLLSGNQGIFTTAEGFPTGGGIFNYTTMTITNSTLSGNSVTSGAGGGIYNNGSFGLGIATLTDSTLSGNSALDTLGAGIGSGGGIYNFLGPLTITGSTLSGNSASFNGAGIRNNAGTVTVIDSTLSGNSAGNNGGAIGNAFGGTLTISGCTLSDNSAAYGGAIYNGSGSTATVTGSTVSNNTATGDGGGIYNLGTLSVGTSNFSGNGPDALANFGTFIDLGGNTGL